MAMWASIMPAARALGTGLGHPLQQVCVGGRQPRGLWTKGVFCPGYVLLLGQVRAGPACGGRGAGCWAVLRVCAEGVHRSVNGTTSVGGSTSACVPTDRQTSGCARCVLALGRGSEGMGFRMFQQEK